MELGDATGSPQFFVDALAAAKAASPNGPMVSAKTLEEVTAPGTVPFMTKDGLAGAMVTADGDIEAVFKHPDSKAKQAMTPLLLTAVHNGGRKLDCYGDALANMYMRHGFVPVGRMDYVHGYDAKMDALVDANLASGDWNEEPRVYAMMLRPGLDAQAILSRKHLAESEGGLQSGCVRSAQEAPRKVFVDASEAGRTQDTNFAYEVLRKSF